MPGRRGWEAPSYDGSLIGTRYRWTTPETEARVVAAIEQRFAVSFTIANQVTTSARIEAVHGNKQD